MAIFHTHSRWRCMRPVEPPKVITRICLGLARLDDHNIQISCVLYDVARCNCSSAVGRSLCGFTLALPCSLCPALSRGFLVKPCFIRLNWGLYSCWSVTRLISLFLRHSEPRGKYQYHYLGLLLSLFIESCVKEASESCCRCNKSCFGCLELSCNLSGDSHHIETVFGRTVVSSSLLGIFFNVSSVAPICLTYFVVPQWLVREPSETE